MDNDKIIRLKSFFKDPIISVPLAVSLLIDAGLWWLLYTKFHGQTDYVPLHYNIYFGIDLFGPWYKILLIPLSGLAFFFINFGLSLIMYKRVKMFSHILIIGLCLSELILLGAGYLIVRELIV
ncbi:MAG: hypothetical protein PHI73_02145 [Patescibacteria group bacterium]|nr:hypothetical protein [Patescibacteria group bacterium]